VIHLDESGMATRAGLPSGQPRLVDPALVTEHTTLFPRDLLHQLVVHLVGAGHEASDDVHPRRLVQVGPLDRGIG
jgi:hypothetical protein